MFTFFVRYWVQVAKRCKSNAQVFYLIPGVKPGLDKQEPHKAVPVFTTIT